jgi:hypothetical protein
MDIPCISNISNISRQSHKKVRATCSLQNTEKCPHEVVQAYRDIMNVMERNDGMYMCLHCSRKLKSTGRDNPNCKYKDIDDDFYTSVDTEFKAYLLGWIASDGSISNGTIMIEIKDVDIDILEILRDNICKSVPITRRYNGSMDSIRLSIHSKKIVEDVCDLLDIVPGKKSRTVKFPDEISNDLKWHFIRGLFDGDGTIRKMKDNNHSRECGIASISQDMKEKIRDFCNIQCHINHESIIYTGINSMKFLFAMYNNCSFKLERKHIEYLKYVEYYGFDGEKDNRMYGPNEKIILLRSIRKSDGEVQDFHSYVSAERFLKQKNPSACGSNIGNVVNKDDRSAYGYKWLLYDT